MLTVTDLRIAYGKAEVVHGVSFEVGAGECVALIGPNGAGKSTILKAVCGLMQPTGGDIRFEGRSIAGLPGHEVARIGIAMCPEGRQMFPEMTVMENLRLGAYRRRRENIAPEIEEVLALFPRLRERASQMAGTLSGGEQEMVAIGRALMARPRLCILDEPSLGIAPKVVDEIEETLMKIKQLGVTILLVEQAVSMALRVADRAYVLEAGEVVTAGTSEEMSNDPRVQSAYLGA
ncbi:MAG: ABC transporter ATP-binding protein [Aquamicrobium sp.]|nr:ABC transporter ATP-binding protein [Aquamicrobium sp.]